MKEKHLENFIKGKLKKNIPLLIAWLVAVCLCGLYVFAAGNSYYMADDFSHYNHVAQASGETWLIKSLKATAENYFSWGGCYFAFFLQFLLSPTKFGGLQTYRIIMVINIILIFTGIYYFLYEMFLWQKLRPRYVIYLFVFLMVPILFFGDYSELIYWFSGACSYTFPASMLFYGISFLLAGRRKQNKILFIPAVIGLVCMAGGSMEVAGFGCYLLLFLLFVNWLQNRKGDKALEMGFCVAFVFSIFAAVAPGNFVRHNVISGGDGVQLISSLIGSGASIILQTWTLLTDTPFLAFLLMSYSYGIWGKKNVTVSQCLYVGLVGLGLPIATIFPVLLGYHRRILTVTGGRFAFLIYLAITISLYLFAFSMGALFKNSIQESGKLLLKIVTGMVIVTIMCSYAKPLMNYQPIQIMYGLITGSIAEYADGVMGAYERIENSKEQNVIVSEWPEPVNGCLAVTFSDDTGYWVNVALAEYYGKKSVSFCNDVD